MSAARKALESDIRAAELHLESLREDARENPSTWGDMEPARELLRGRLQYMREILAGLPEEGDRTGRKHADLTPTVKDVPMWQFLLGVGAVVVVVTAMLLRAAGVL